MDALTVDAVVNLQQQVTLFDPIKILHLYVGNIAIHLGADKRRKSAYVSVIGKLRMPCKRGQLPRIKNHQHAYDADSSGGKKGDNTQIIARISLIFGGILLAHNVSWGKTVFMLCDIPYFVPVAFLSAIRAVILRRSKRHRIQTSVAVAMPAVRR